MTLLNIHVKDEDKKKLQKYVETIGGESMSDVVRSMIQEKIKIDEVIAALPPVDQVDIPDYVPKDKYVIFVNGAIVGVGDNPSELAELALQKFPDLPFVMKYNGKKKPFLEHVFMSLSNVHAWRYCIFEGHSFPMLPIEFQCSDKNKKTLYASIDTAATLCVMKENVLPIDSFTSSRKEKISTADGILESQIYEGIVKILDTSFEIEFIITPMPDELPFKFLIGRNLLDQLDAYFLGKKQVLLLKQAEL
nr:hypothetical protein [Candidatus Sigynarchaeota archaeon]